MLTVEDFQSLRKHKIILLAFIISDCNSIEMMLSITSRHDCICRTKTEVETNSCFYINTCRFVLSISALRMVSHIYYYYLTHLSFLFKRKKQTVLRAKILYLFIAHEDSWLYCYVNVVEKVFKYSTVIINMFDLVIYCNFLECNIILAAESLCKNNFVALYAFCVLN